jgi:GT2 family glycosyltransferase
VAGNKRRLPNQPSWAFVDSKFTWDDKRYLSGIVGHGSGFPPKSLNFYGQTGKEVKLLDGVFIACKSELLKTNNLMFDEKFNFHFYDLDFCRSAEQKKIKMGTWSITLIHESSGNFGSPGWIKNRDAYFKKWGDA